MAVFPIPVGLLGGLSGFRYIASENNPDVFVDLGSPAGVAARVIILEEGVVIGSTTTAAAFDLTGFTAGSSFTIVGEGVGNLRGRIQGLGGGGGDGGFVLTQWLGGGGGGAGTTPGVGGQGGSGNPGGEAADGLPGTSTAGGAGGPPVSRSGTTSGLGTDGSVGGLALATRGFATTLLDIAVWGGGGGGAGSEIFGNLGGKGGDPGIDGANTNRSGGVAGDAIDHDGATPTQQGATDVRGDIVA